MNTFDIDEVKHEIWSTKVLGTRQEIQNQCHRRNVSHNNQDTGAGGGSFSGQSASDGDGGSETFDPDDEPMARAAVWNSSIANSSGASSNWMESEGEADTTTKSVTKTPVDKSVFGKELSSREFRSIEEQKFRAMQVLFDQKDRHFAIRFHGGPKAPLFVMTPTVSPAPVSAESVEEYRQRLLEQLPFALRMADAEKRMAGREHKLLTDLIKVADIDEPHAGGRRIK